MFVINILFFNRWRIKLFWTYILNVSVTTNRFCSVYFATEILMGLISAFCRLLFRGFFLSFFFCYDIVGCFSSYDSKFFFDNVCLFSRHELYIDSKGCTRIPGSHNTDQCVCRTKSVTRSVWGSLLFVIVWDADWIQLAKFIVLTTFLIKLKSIGGIRKSNM